MTKIAFRAESIASLRTWIESGPEAHLTTRYLPKRHEEMVGGSLYWIYANAIVARSPLLGFEQREDRRWTIRLAPQLIMVEPLPKRGHQGWRYLKPDKAPRDLAPGESSDDVMPGKLIKKLSRLGLV